MISEEIQVLQSGMFRRAYKRLHPNQKADVDDAVAEIVLDPTIGKPKLEIWQAYLYIFKCNGQLTLLAYEYDAASRFLRLLGSHENFYQDLKRDK